MKIKASLVSDIGKIRNINQDNFYFDKKINRNALGRVCENDKIFNGTKVFAVLDGMGGEAYGEKASLIAAKTIKKYCRRNENKCYNNFNDIIYDANERICRHIEKHGRGMGTTIAILGIDTEKCTASGANVGDTKIFLIRDKKLHFMSRDHNISAGLAELGVISREEAWKHEDKNKLTQYLGIFEDDFRIEAHITDEIMMEQGDIIMMCTDGLTDGLSSGDIIRIANMDLPISEKCRNMVEEAIKNGSRDNITVFMAEAFK